MRASCSRHVLRKFMSAKLSRESANTDITGVIKLNMFRMYKFIVQAGMNKLHT